MADEKEIVGLPLSSLRDAWAAMEGIFADNPLFDEWQAAIAEYRDQVDRRLSGDDETV